MQTPTIAPAATAGLQTRSLKVLALDDNLRSELLRARQAVRIRRWRRQEGKHASIETVHYLTDLPPAATPDDLGRLIRGHWGIEGRLHLVRDLAFNEDHHRARTGNAPQNLAVLRNIAITCTAKTQPPAFNPPSAPPAADPKDFWTYYPKPPKPARSTLVPPGSHIWHDLWRRHTAYAWEPIDV